MSLDNNVLQSYIKSQKDNSGVVAYFEVNLENIEDMNEVALALGENEEVNTFQYKFTINNKDVEDEALAVKFKALTDYLLYKNFEVAFAAPPIEIKEIEIPTTTVLPSFVRQRGFEVVEDKHRKFPEVDIKLPKRGSKHSAGYDIYSPTSLILEPGEKTKFATDVKAYMQPNEVLIVLPRSSIGIRAVMITNTAGVVDSDYYSNNSNDGNMYIFLNNLGTEDLVIEAGDRVAQAIFIPYLLTDADSLDSGEERSGGYGHTGR